MLQPLLIAIVCVAALLIVVEAASLRRMPPAAAYPPPPSWPRVSILVPARDEEDDVGRCLRSLLAQDYPDFEVLALDDGSRDGTLGVMETIEAEAGGRLRSMRGSDPPPGWIGKPWACMQLAESASGDLLLFTDADTVHAPGALRAVVSALLAEHADLVTSLAYVQDCTWGERLVLPCIPWSSITMLPLPLAYRSRLPWLATANGQYMLFTRDGYDAVGGHSAVQDDVLDDIRLAQAVKAAGRTWRLTDGTALVATRMYSSFRGVFDGLGKNMFSVFGNGVGRFLAAWVVIAVVFLTPTATLLAAAAGYPAAVASAWLAALAWAMTAAQFAFGFRRFGYGAPLALLHPLMMGAVTLIAAWSLILAVTGSARWKGRPLGRREVRWL